MYEHVAGPGELQGVARNNSIESVLARAGNRVTGFEDVFEFAAFTYAASRSAMRLMTVTEEPRMDTCLTVSGMDLDFATVETGDMIN